jgi:AraC-like DNA-binding protein
MAERVKRVIELMQGDPSRSFTLGKMAESVNLSPPYFCYLFKTITGVPPAKYLKALRMQHAATLLTTTFLSVKEIAFQVGLHDESHFVRDFKTTYGFSPALYRSQFKNKTAPEPHNGSGIGSGHGPTNGKSTQPTSVREHLVQIAKHTVLPSVHLFIYVFSYLT